MTHRDGVTDTGLPPWLAEVPARPLVERDLVVRIAMVPGDRALVEPGTTITAGDPLLERLRDRRVAEVPVEPPGTPDAVLPPAAGRRRLPLATGRRRSDPGPEGEFLMPVPGERNRWRIATGDQRDPVFAPAGGVVEAVVPGAEISVRATGLAIRGAFSAGSPASGRLDLATDPFGELRPGGIDVSRTGSILVVGSRIDAEALTRARAMGVRGIVVASLPSKDLRDFLASERRQRASAHAAPPFGVLVLEGTVRRRIPLVVLSLLERLAGRDVALLTDPPALVFEATDDELPDPDPFRVRVRAGASLGAEGRVAGPAGLRRFARGVHLEAATVVLDDGPTTALPLGDLERFA
jgi:hypothetical protein